MTEKSAPHPRVYGRRQGRPLRVRKSRLMKELLPKIRINLPDAKEISAGALKPDTLFSQKPKDIWLEIGFGGGEHIAAQAMKHPEAGFIGCEPFVNGVASLLDHVDRDGITNIRLFPDDARLVLDALPDASIARCHVLFPDPWPKARHAERRFIGPENIQRLARVLRPGALLDIASDDPRLQAWMQKCMAEAQDFKQIHAAQQPPDDWISTRYEQKAYKAKRQPIYWRFVRG